MTTRKCAAKRSSRSTSATLKRRSPSLWALDLDPHKTKRFTEDRALSADDFRSRATASGSASAASRRIATSAASRRRISTRDLYLLETATGTIERLTTNAKSVRAASASRRTRSGSRSRRPDDIDKYSMTNARVYLRAVAERGKPFRKMGSSFDGDVTVGFWSKDSSTIYFNEGIRATNQLVALDVARTVRPDHRGESIVSVDRDEDSGVLLDHLLPTRDPSTLFTVDAVKNASSRARGGS